VGQAARGRDARRRGERGLDCYSYTPQQIKAAVCGSGRAGKEQVRLDGEELLSLAALPATDHAADALAVAICHVNHAPVAAALAR